MADDDRPLIWLGTEIKTPPFSRAARIEAGVLLRSLQVGIHVGMPHSRPMPSIGPRCHELRIIDAMGSWRIIYRLDVDSVVVVDVFTKKTRATPDYVLATCRQRLRRYDAVTGQGAMQWIN